MSFHPETPRVRLVCALATAVLWWLATLSGGWFALGWIAPLPLLWSLYGLNARARFLAGWRCGFFSFALLNWWIAVAITRGAPMIGVSPFGGFWLGILGVALIGVIHGLMLAIVALLCDWRALSSTRFPWLWPLGVASLWTLLDIARCSGALAHSWGALAFTQWRDVALLQSASLFGQHGLTFVCVWFAASLALWLRAAPLQRKPILWRAPLLAFAVLHVWGAWRVQRFDASAPKNSLRVLLVQTASDSFNGRDAFAQAYEMTARATRQQKYDLVVWPETTFVATRQFTGAIAKTNARPADIEYSISDLGGLEAQQTNMLSREIGTPILSGAGVPLQYGSRSNQALLFDGGAIVRARIKSHLVPFGERAPWSEQLPFLRALAPSPEVEAGGESEPLTISSSEKGRTVIGSLICFESCFAEPSRSLSEKGARFLFVLTNDEWCRGTEAPWQHAAMSALRAVENDVPIAQSANGGYSFAVDQRGRFVVKSTFNVPQIVEVVLDSR